MMYILVTSVVTFIYEVRTLAVDRRFSTGGRRKHRHDFRLLGRWERVLLLAFQNLVYALLQFLIQVGLFVYSVCMSLAFVTQNQQLLTATQLVHPFLTDMLCSALSICILCTRSQNYLEI